MSQYSLTINDKLEIIDYYEREKPSMRDLASKFKIGKTQAANIIKNMDKIRGDSLMEDSKKNKKYFSPQGKIIDTFTYDWYLDCVKQNQPITGRLIKEKALEIARNINYSGFCASNGWLQRWRVRNNVNLKPIPHGEPIRSFNSDYFHKYPTNGREANPYLQTSIGETSDFRRNDWNSCRNMPDADYFDPLAFTEVSYGKHDNQDNDGDDDDLIPLSDNESPFKIDSFESALHVVEDLKNFAQDDDIALNYLSKLECHFKKEQLK